MEGGREIEGGGGGGFSSAWTPWASPTPACAPPGAGTFSLFGGGHGRLTLSVCKAERPDQR